MNPNIAEAGENSTPSTNPTDPADSSQITEFYANGESIDINQSERDGYLLITWFDSNEDCHSIEIPETATIYGGSADKECISINIQVYGGNIEKIYTGGKGHNVDEVSVGICGGKINNLYLGAVDTSETATLMDLEFLAGQVNSINKLDNINVDETEILFYDYVITSKQLLEAGFSADQINECIGLEFCLNGGGWLELYWGPAYYSSYETIVKEKLIGTTLQEYYNEYLEPSDWKAIIEPNANTGFEFKGWYKDPEFKEKWDLSSKITENDIELQKIEDEYGNVYYEKRISLYAKWELLDVARFAGNTRYETSTMAADALKANLGVDCFGTVIIASGKDFADALAGSYLANIYGAPILIIDDESKETVNYIMEYLEENLYVGEDVGNVYILGGTGAISKDVENKLARYYNVTRLAGSNRYETNLEILKEAGVYNEDILVCSGLEYADSLSSSAVGKPILLVDSKLSKEQKSYLNSIDTEKMYLVGGIGAVSSNVEKDLKGYQLKRLAGKDRFETSALVAKEFFKDSKISVIAYGYNFPDGLSGGPLAMSINAPLLLASENSVNISSAKAYAKEAGIEKTVVLGGRGLIPDSIAESLLN